MVDTCESKSGFMRLLKYCLIATISQPAHLSNNSSDKHTLNIMWTL